MGLPGGVRERRYLDVGGVTYSTETWVVVTITLDNTCPFFHGRVKVGYQMKRNDTP